MKTPWFQFCMLILLTAGSLMVSGCGAKHSGDPEYTAFFEPTFSRQQIETFFAPAPNFQPERVPPSVINQSTRAPEFQPERVQPSVINQSTPIPEPQPATYPIHKVMNGKKHSISVYPTGVVATSCLLIERIIPLQVTMKKDFECLVKLTNISMNTLYDVILTEPQSSIFRSGEPTPIANKDGALIWKLGHLSAQDTRTIKMWGNALQPDRINDCVTVVYSSLQRDCVDIDVVNPSLKLAQTGPKSVIQCESIPIILEVTNHGSGLASNVPVREELPEGLLTLDDKKVISFQAGDLRPGESNTVKVNLKAIKTGLFDMRAQAISQDNAHAYADYNVNVIRPILGLTTSGPRKSYASRPVQYEMTVTNNGDGPANNLFVTEMIPPGAAYVSASDGGVASNNMVVWSLGNLAPMESRKVSVRIRTDNVGTIINQAKAQAFCSSASSEYETVVEGIAAILLEVVDLDDPIEIGSNSTYVISVTNQGSAVGTNIKIVATLPDELEYVASYGPTKATVNGKVVSFTPLPSLAAKLTAEYRVEVKGVKTGDVRFHIEMRSDQMSSPVMETESTYVY